MISVYKAMSAPLAALIIFVLGASYFMTYSALYFKGLGLSDQWLGFLQASYYAGMLMASCVCEALIKRWGPILSFSAACLLGAVTTVWLGLSEDPWLWLIIRFGSGFAMAIIYIVIESWLLALGDSKSQSQVIAIYMVALYITQALSQYLLDIPVEQAWMPFVLTGLGLLVAFVPLLGSHPPVTAPSHVSLGSNVLTLLRQAPFGVLASGLAGAILGSIYCFAPPFALEYGLSVSLLMSLIGWGGVSLQWPIGRLADRFNRQLFLAFTSALVVFAALAIVWWSDTPTLVFVFSFLLGGAAYTLYPQSIVAVVQQAPSTSLTAITAIQSVAYSIGSTLGPLIVPFFTAYWNMAGLYFFIATGALLLTSVGLLVYLTSKRPTWQTLNS